MMEEEYEELENEKINLQTWKKLLKVILKSKKDSLSSKSAFLGEGIFTMGLVKTIYNVLGGFYI